MMNNNHKDSGCGYAEQLIAYLYDESNESEKAVFEKHLAACPLCTDELQVFSGVHFAINDWKAQEFSSLAMPVIEIPYETKQKTVEIKAVSSSWWSNLSEMFRFAPRAWSVAGAMFAILAVCLGIALFAFNSRQGNEVAESNTNIKAVTAPTIEKAPAKTNVNNRETTPADNQSKPIVEQKAPQPEIAETNGANSTNTRSVKIVNTTRQPPRAENPRKNSEVKAVNKTNNEKIAPKVVDQEDEEDDTLRLSEIFDEIDTK